MKLTDIFDKKENNQKKSFLEKAIYPIRTAICGATICIAVWGTPMFVLDATKATYNMFRDRVQNGKTQEVNYNQGSIVRAPFPTPYTNYTIPIAGTLGGIGGLITRIEGSRKKK